MTTEDKLKKKIQKLEAKKKEYSKLHKERKRIFEMRKDILELKNETKKLKARPEVIAIKKSLRSAWADAERELKNFIIALDKHIAKMKI